MRRWVVVMSALSLSLGAATAVAGTASAGNDNDPYTLSGGNAQAGPMAGIVPARGQAGSHGPNKTPPLLTWHGGDVRSSATTVNAVFWGAFAESKDPVVTAMDTFYRGASGSSYLGTNTEYTDGGGTAFNYSGAQVSPSITVGTAYFDHSATGTRAPSTGAVLAAVQRATGGNVSLDHYYPVYSDIPRGHAGYCAWHSTGSINGTRVEFGFFFKLDGDPGCDPQSPVTTYSEGIAALGNVSGHELSEMLTDPQLNAWYDAQGAENSDKCAWTFGANLISFGGGGSSWKIQGNWSNNAATRAIGYIDPSTSKSVLGCVDGTNASAPTA